MRVLHCILSRGFRGAERYVAELTNYQAQHHDLMLVVRADPKDGTGASIEDHLAGKAELKRLPSLLPSLALRWHVKRWRPDLVHLHGGRASVVAAHARLAVPKVATMHLDYRAKWYRGVDALIALTNVQRDASVSGGFVGVVQRTNPWVLEAPAPSTDALKQLRIEMGGAADSKIILVAAALYPAKGLTWLLEAFRQALEPTWRLAIAGEGPQRAELEVLARGDSRVRLLGYRKDVRELMHAADVFCLSSRDEAFGLVILEAMSAGLPIVATRTQGPREILGEPLVAYGDTKALLAALTAAVHAGRHCPDLTRWSLTTAGRDIEALYTSLVRQAAASTHR